MKKIYLKALILALTPIVCISCGGGGGDDGTDVRFVGGTWRGSLTKISDTCSNGDTNTPAVQHQVNQVEEAIELLNEAGVKFLGNTVANDGFSVDGLQTVNVRLACTDSARIRYTDIDDNDDATASVEWDITRSCPGRANCEISYSGTTARSSGEPNATPIPSGQATATPAASNGQGCLAINPNTEAGSYSGDGGCGISSTVYRSEQQATESVVVLEPFGANGATSFVVSAANSSSASSRRTDLEIKGVPGYTCSLVCSPPSTFTINCFIEGGATCIEKF